jgi:ADP-ribose pyrophosphatase
MQAIVLGTDAAPGRVRFYAEILRIEPVRDGSQDRFDLGPGGPEAEALAELVMQAHGSFPAAAVGRRLGSLHALAASRVRAMRPGSRQLRVGTGEVTVTERRQPHAGFFGLEVLTLTHARFDGTTSPPVTREVLLSGDAVTDPLPWQLEAIAGRIDPGETPEGAARREAVEEAGLELGDLLKVAEYYPTPGAMAEYLYSFVALCDLPDGVAGVFGAADEIEDIRGLLLSVDALLAAMADGEITNAPLLLTVLWLQRERDRLRG